jgi:succinate dehydrogenase / fumarate reductase, cytochrome b subunit
MTEAGLNNAKRGRPLSPHLSIYRPMLTMMMSIAHRITGVVLYGGTFLLAWWLMAAAAGPNGYARLQWFIGSIFGQLILIGCTFALLHHLLGGIRHLIWDLGYGFEPAEREWLARASLIGSVTLTILIVILGYMFVGQS